MSFYDTQEWGEKILQGFEKVDKARQEEWDKSLSTVQNELNKEAATYIHEERARLAKVAELSLSKMLG